jgi:hypothetical protein
MAFCERLVFSEWLLCELPKLSTYGLETAPARHGTVRHTVQLYDRRHFESQLPTRFTNLYLLPVHLVNLGLRNGCPHRACLIAWREGAPRKAHWIHVFTFATNNHLLHESLGEYHYSLYWAERA